MTRGQSTAIRPLFTPSLPGLLLVLLFLLLDLFVFHPVPVMGNAAGITADAKATGLPVLMLDLPTVGDLTREGAASAGGLGLSLPYLSREYTATAHPGLPEAEKLETAEGAKPPPLPVPQALSAAAASKLDPLLRIILRRDRAARAAGHALNLAEFAPLVEVYSSGQPLLTEPVPTAMQEFLAPEPPRVEHRWAGELGVLVRAPSPEPLQLVGAQVIGQVGDITLARLSLAQLRRLAELPEVEYIEAAYRLEPELDKSVPAIGADRLHEGEPPVTGTGVLVGDVDTGIDYQHLDFRVDRDGDGFEESSRILYIWDQTETGPFGDRGAVPFGTEYTGKEIESDLAHGLGPDAGLVRERDESGHGTHVMSIAAGDGSSSGAGYIGVAPDATMIMVKTSFYTSDVVAGVNYIFNKAAELGEPCVVNLSLGGHFGPHDGTSNFDRALVNLLGPGRIIVTSAGNEGDERIHIGGRLRYVGDERAYDFIPAEDTVYLNIWYPGDAEFTLELEAPVAPGLAQIITAESGTALSRETRAGRVSIDNASAGPDPDNGDKQIAVLLENITPGQPWRVRLIAAQGSGRFDGWPGLSSMGEFVQGDSEMTVSEPGDAEEIITVGAYTTRYEWRAIDGNKYHFRGAVPVGQLAPFSSHGPTRDGRRKPDLAAPGTAIVAALARGSELSQIPQLIVPDGVHAVLQGTSMAAPHVAGTVALMLQTYPRLRPEEAAEKLRGTARRDAMTGRAPNLTWGYGKLNAERGVNLVGLELPEAGGRPEVKAGSNPASERLYFTYTLPPGTHTAKLIVFNVVGKPVFTAQLDLTADKFAWDLVDNNGRPLANGLYIYVIIADGVRSALHRLVIRR